MRPDARIQTIIEIMDAVLESKRGADFVIQQALRQRRYMGGGDRRFVKGRLYDLFHAWGELHHRLLQADPVSGQSPRLAVALQEMLRHDVKVTELFTGKPHAPQPLTEQELEVLENAASLKVDDPAVLANQPDWVWQKLEQAYGEAASSVAASLNTPAPLDVRLLKEASRRVFLDECRDVGDAVSTTPWSLRGVRFAKNVPMGNIPHHGDGTFIVQDEGSQLVASLTGIVPNTTGWDVCAGGGGKTIALLDRLNGSEGLIATDVESKRLKELQKRVPDEQLQGLISFPLPANWLDQDDLPDPLQAAASQIHWAMIDAPCSGTGSWRRTPFERWRLTEDRLQQLKAVQSKLLDRVAAVLPAGGLLTYVTCSVLPEENQDQITAFLQRYPHFEILTLAELWQSTVDEGLLQKIEDTGVGLSLRPDLTNTDGFYLAVLRSKA